MGGAVAAGFAEARERASCAEPPGLPRSICGVALVGGDGGRACGGTVFAAQGSVVPRQAQLNSGLHQLAARERTLRAGGDGAARRRASRLAACGARGGTGGHTGTALRGGCSGRRAVEGLGRVITLALGSVGAAGGPPAREAAAIAGGARLGGRNPQATGHWTLSGAAAGGGAAGGARVARAHAGGGVGGVGGTPRQARDRAAAARGAAVARGFEARRLARPCAAMGTRRLPPSGSARTPSRGGARCRRGRLQ